MTSTSATAVPFEYDGGVVEPGTTARFRFQVSETSLGEPVRIPVTVVNGVDPGPTAFLSAALHGDELNGVAVVREVAHEWGHDDLCGTVVCLPVLSPQGFQAQQRYLPITDQDLNRSFPGDPEGTAAQRICHAVYENFVAPCDFGLDFHTSTRGRANTFHVRADVTDPAVARLANAFGTNLAIAGRGAEGMLRRVASEDGVPVVTLEMGKAHRFERDLIDHALDGVRSVFAEYELYQQETVRWPGWRAVVAEDGEKTWLRANAGGIVEMHAEKGELVREGATICTISNPFGESQTTVAAPFTGLLVGVLENPVVSPGNPLCHFVALNPTVRRVVETVQGDARAE